MAIRNIMISRLGGCGELLIIAVNLDYFVIRHPQL